MSFVPFSTMDACLNAFLAVAGLFIQDAVLLLFTWLNFFVFFERYWEISARVHWTVHPEFWFLGSLTFSVWHTRKEILIPFNFHFWLHGLIINIRILSYAEFWPSGTFLGDEFKFINNAPSPSDPLSFPRHLRLPLFAPILLLKNVLIYFKHTLEFLVSVH